MNEYIQVKKDYYNNGQLKFEHPNYEGQRHGTARGWYRNGQLWHEMQYHQGQRHGIERGWHNNGRLSYKMHWLYDKEVTKEEYREHELIETLSGLMFKE